MSIKVSGCKQQNYFNGLNMYKKSAFVFLTTLVLYILTLFTVSYVGVYLTYIAIPLIVISGLIMILSKPKKKVIDREDSELISPVKEFGKAVNGCIDVVNTSLGELNSSLESYNIKMNLIKKRTEGLKEKRHKLELEKIKPEIENFGSPMEYNSH